LVCFAVIFTACKPQDLKDLLVKDHRMADSEINTKGFSCLALSIFGLPVSDNIGEPPNKIFKGSPGLVIGKKKAKGRVWHHILAGDGQDGWTDSSLTITQPAEIRLQQEFLYNISPDHPDWMDKYREIYSKPFSRLTLIDVCPHRYPSYPMSLEYLSLPEEINPYHTIWLKVRIQNESTGWVSVENVSISRKNNKRKPAKSLIFDDPCFAGLIRLPFLYEYQDQLLAVRPKTDKDLIWVYDWLDWEKPGLKKAKFDVEQEIKRASIFLKNPSNKPNGISSVVFFEPGNILCFVSSAGTNQYLSLQSYGASVLDFEITDLDKDGYDEWILDVVYPAGVNYWRSLLIVDGQNIDKTLTLQRIMLEEAYGEDLGELNGWMSSLWWIDSPAQGCQSEIWYYWQGNFQNKTEHSLKCYLYQNKRLQEKKDSSFFSLVWLAQFSTKKEADQQRLRYQQSIQPLFTLPAKLQKKDGWIVGRVFSDVNYARKWIGFLKTKGIIPKLNINGLQIRG
jgi:hypothetical protein